MLVLRKVLVVCLAFLGVPAAQAQWVMVARAAANRVQRMEQQKTDKNGGYDVATVILEAAPDKVYERALSGLMAHASEITITSADQQNQSLKFTNGEQSASLQVNSLGPKVSQLVIASGGAEAGQSGTSIVLQGVLKVCKEMNVNCTVQ